MTGQEWLLPIDNVVAADVRGERRWTGSALVPGFGTVPLVVLPVAGGLRAIKGKCPHAGVSLLKGRLVEGGLIECPSHGWQLPLAGGALGGWDAVERDGALYLVLPPTA